MNKKHVSAIGIAALISSVAGISYLNQPCISPKIINYETTPQEGYSFRIIAPDNHYCVITGAVMTKADYVRLQNNVGAFAVDMKTEVHSKPTYEYCEIAKWLWNAHTNTYPEYQTKYKDLMLPADCRVTIVKLSDSLAISDEANSVITIPEFPYSMLILTIGLLPMILWRMKK